MTQDELNNKPNNEYRAEDIQILDEIEAVRLRPGMYVGSTDREGLHQLLYEIVYNSIDEAMAGSCDQIEVTIHPDNSVTVVDDGRGIPVDIIPETDITALQAVMTHLHAGAKFGGAVYQISSGLHGVGASVVNALSSWLKVEVRREGNIYRQEYQQGIPIGDIETIGHTQDTGTKIMFLADSLIFEDNDYDFGTVCQRLRELAFLNSGVELVIRHERSDAEKTFYFEGGIATLISRVNKNRTVIHPEPILLKDSVNSTAIEVALQYNDSSIESTFSFANCVSTRDGGSHLTGFRSALTRVLNDYARNNKFIKDTEPNLTGEDVREGIVAIISVKLPQPQFEGQTKAKLGNPEVKSQVEYASFPLRQGKQHAKHASSCLRKAASKYQSCPESWPIVPKKTRPCVSFTSLKVSQPVVPLSRDATANSRLSSLLKGKYLMSRKPLKTRLYNMKR